jgi:hypothetical protein
VRGSELLTSPIPESAVLRVSGSRHTGRLAPHAVGTPLAADMDTGALVIAKGSQVEVRLLCTSAGLAPPTHGKTAIRTLSTTDGTHYTEIGYDWALRRFYADHSLCCPEPQLTECPPSRVAAHRGIPSLPSPLTSVASGVRLQARTRRATLCRLRHSKPPRSGALST